GIEQGMRSVARHNRTELTIKKREIRQIGDRAVGLLDVRIGDGWMRNAVVLVGRSELNVSNLGPMEEAERQRAGFDTMVEQLAHLEPPTVGPAERYMAQGEAAGTGLAIAILPSIGLAAIFRRRR